MNASTDRPTCRAVSARGLDCSHPAVGRLVIGNTPLCGLHLRAAEARGDEVREDPTLMSLRWHRREGGYMRSDGAWFLLRGAPMTHGANAWLVHRRVDDESRIGLDAPSAYDTRNGDLLWTISSDGYADTSRWAEGAGSRPALYAHVFDCGWLSEAKASVEDTEASEARS